VLYVEHKDITMYMRMCGLRADERILPHKPTACPPAYRSRPLPVRTGHAFATIGMVAYSVRVVYTFSRSAGTTASASGSCFGPSFSFFGAETSCVDPSLFFTLYAV
jgi:hypothetical protein